MHAAFTQPPAAHRALCWLIWGLLAAQSPGCSSGYSRQSPGLGGAERESSSGVEPRIGHGVVARVDDGDSVTLADGRRLRYLGIDAPERGEPFHQAAKAENRRLIEGKPVTWRQVNPEHHDHYGRWLVLVEVGDGAARVSVPAALLEAGLASVYIKDDDQMPAAELAPLLAAQGAAIDERRGLWRDRLLRGSRLSEPLVATRHRLHSRGCEAVRGKRVAVVEEIERELKRGKSLCRSCRPLVAGSSAQVRSETQLSR